MHAVFAGEWLLDAAVEEVGDVGVLLGLGDAQVAHVEVGHDVGQDVAERLGRRNDRQGEVLVVLRHADVGQVFGNAIARDDGVEFVGAFEFAAILRGEVAVAGQAAGNLAGAVGAEVEIDADVAVANSADGLAAAVGDDEWNDELVGDAAVVGLLHALHRIGVAAAFGVAEDHRVESLLFAVPLLVAVHGVVAAADGGDFADAVLAHLLLELLDVAGAIGRKRVAAVHEAVDEDALHAVLLGHAQERVQVGLMRVDSAVGEQAEKMQAADRRCAPGSMASSSAGLYSNSPFSIITSILVMSMYTTRPAPMLRWPTSLLPICPVGRPT